MNTADPLGPTIEHVNASDGRLLGHHYRRPFQPPEARLDDVLMQEFAWPALRWLCGPAGASPPSMVVSAHAEVAMTILGAATFMQLHDLEHEYLRTKIDVGARWLCESIRTHSDGTGCWDHSAWDTAVAVRALMAVVTTDHAPEISDKVVATVDSGLGWLARRLDEAESGHAAVLLNPAEYAQIGRCLAEASILTSRGALADGDINYGAVLNNVSTVLIRRRSEKMIEILGDDDRVQVATIWWGDFFGTSEVLRFYLTLNDALVAEAINLDRDTKVAIRESVAKSLLLIEHSHFDGVWGAYLDTIALLGSYVSLGACDEGLFAGQTLAEGLTSQPRIVFRVLRWMCDPTQRCDDGSILHTAFLTTFYLDTILAVARSWKFSPVPIAVVYDEMCLLLETGVSEQRVGQIAALVSRDEALEDLAAMEAEARSERRRTALERWLRMRLAISITLAFLCFGGVILAAQLAGWATVSVPNDHTADLLALIGVASGSALAVIGILWTAGRPEPIE